jgi:hypothetical protein
MENWMSQRVAYLNTVINNYSEGSIQTTKTDCGTMTCAVTMSHQSGYHQTVTVNIDEGNLLSMLGINKAQLNGTDLKIVPLKKDGTEGENNTNGVYGAWFEGDDNPGFWANGHVFIEINENLTSWICGLRAEQGFCTVGEHHSVRMQYQHTQGTETKTVTIVVNFTIAA